MGSALDYHEMARECILEAEACRDAQLKNALLEIAKLYNETALALDAAEAPPLKAAGRGRPSL